MYKADKEYKAKNYKAAIDMYNRGCYMGFFDACLSLGNMYIKGDGVKADMQKAKRYLNISCHKGHTISCDTLNKEKQRKIDEKKQIRAAKIYKIKKRLQEANYFMQKNIPLPEAKKWQDAGFSAKDAYYYISKNISLDEAKKSEEK